jgi:phosphoserine phosphatase
MKILVKVYGRDAPGITAAITAVLDREGARLLDIEQAVTHGLLSLMVLADSLSSSANDLERNLQDALSSFALKLEVLEVEASEQEPDRSTQFVVTLMAPEMSAKIISEVASRLANLQANIESIRRLSVTPTATIELLCSSKQKPNLPALTDDLLALTKDFPQLDLALQREGLSRRAKRLVVFDMDSTLIQGEVIDELADRLGKKEEVATLTKRAMEGEMDFQESLIRRVGLLRGLRKTDLDEVYSGIQLSPGAARLVKALKRLGFRIAIISGGFTFFVDRLKSELGIHYGHANTLDMDGDTVTGRLQGVIVDGRRKADLMELIAQQEGISLDQVIAVGDGANDLQMLKKAGLGIAFNAKPFTKSLVGTSITRKSMDSILYLMGITEDELRDLGLS